LALICAMAGPCPAAVDADILQALTAFDRWAQDYQPTTDPARAAAREASGADLAKKRRLALHSLIQTDPQAAIAHALPMATRLRLPQSVQTLLEQRVDGMGLLTARVEMYHDMGIGEDGEEHPFHRAVRTPAAVMGEARYLPYTYGHRVGLMSTTPVPIHGIAIDGDLAVSELPYRDLAVDETVSGAHASGDATTCGSDAIAAPRIVTGNEIRSICSAAEVDALVQQWAITERELQNGISPTADTSASWTTGSKTFLYIRVRFSDQDAAQVQDDVSAAATMSGLKDFSRAFSYDALFDVVPTLTPILLLPQNTAYYVTNGDGVLLSDARAAAITAGFNYTAFNFYAVRFTGGPGGYAGQAYVGATGIWLKSNSAGVLAHEFGHNLGLWHANAWVPAGHDPLGAGTNSEYGNVFDRMGSGGGIANHFTASAKEILTWLKNKDLVRLWGSGDYRFASQDVAAPPAIGAAAFYPRVRYWMGDATTTMNNGQYWFEHRTQLGPFNRAVHMNTSGTANWFVDNTPQSMNGVQDGGLVLGRTYADPQFGLYVTPIDKQGGTPAGTPATITLRVNSGSFPGNHPPTVSLTPSSATAAVNQIVTLSATASDVDGDALAYSWDWGDFTYDGVNAASATKSWSSAGHYRVRVTATDMKGGTASASTVITVGTPPVTALRGSGQVTLNGVGVEGVHVWNGLTGSNYRGAYTTSDGSYMIPRLVAGSVTLSASRKGLTIAPQFTNPANFTADQANLNFAATELPIVSLTTLTATARPNGTDTLVFRLGRTGPTTSDLKVFFARGGTAYSSGQATPTASDDYTPSTGTNNFATIPAGAATADIVITARLDTVADESDETVTVDLADGIDYEVSYPGRGQGTIVGLAGPPNDAFANSIALTGALVITTGSNRYATLEFNEPPHNGRSTGSGSVWWSWTAPGNGLATVDTFGSAVDTVAAVYTGASLPQLFPVGVNNDAASGVTASRVSFPVTAGSVYRIAIANPSTSALGGNLKLSIVLDPTGGDRIFANSFD
jgi:hypothetical protein